MTTFQTIIVSPAIKDIAIAYIGHYEDSIKTEIIFESKPSMALKFVNCCKDQFTEKRVSISPRFLSSTIYTLTIESM